LSYPPIKLAISYIDGIDALYAALQQTIGKATGRSPYVHGNQATWVNVKRLERSFKFPPPSTDVWLRLSNDFNICLTTDKTRLLVHRDAVHANIPGQDKSSGLLAALSQS
jgi:hypothetical protein